MQQKQTSSIFLVIILLLVVTLCQLAVDLYLPSMPAIAHALQTSHASVQLTLTFYLIGFGISPLVYGPMSDVFGRRPVLFSGVGIFLIAGLGCIFAQSIDMLLFSRLIQGLGIGVAPVMCRALLRDAFSDQDITKVVAYMSMTWAMTPILAPLFGGYIQHYIGWRANFAAMFLYVLICSIIIWRYLPETNQNKHPRVDIKQILKNYLTIIMHKEFLLFVLGSALVYGLMIAYTAASPFLLQTSLGVSPVVFGWLALFVASAYLLGNLINTRIIKLGMKKLIMIGMGLVAFGTFSMLFFALMHIFHVWTVVGPIFIVVVGSSLVYTNYMSGAVIIFKDMAGTAGAMVGCLQMLICGGFTVIVSKLHEFNPLPLSIMFAIVAMVLVLLYLSLFFKETKPSA